MSRAEVIATMVAILLNGNLKATAREIDNATTLATECLDAAEQKVGSTTKAVRPLRRPD